MTHHYFLILFSTVNHPPQDYSHSLYSQIPIKYLLQQARKSQEHYRDLYPPLLRLLVTYYPQLCLVEDWLCEEDDAVKVQTQQTKTLSSTNLTNSAIIQGKYFLFKYIRFSLDYGYVCCYYWYGLCDHCCGNVGIERNISYRYSNSANIEWNKGN